MERIITAVLVAALTSPLVRASSPEPPVQPTLEVVKGAQAQAEQAVVRLHIETATKSDYRVEVRRPPVEAKAGLVASEAKANPVHELSQARPVAIDDAVEARPGTVTHVRYELDITSSDGRYHGLLVVQQAYAVAADGTLEPIDFKEEMRRQAASAPFTPGADQLPAGGPSTVPVS